MDTSPQPLGSRAKARVEQGPKTKMGINRPYLSPLSAQQLRYPHPDTPAPPRLGHDYDIVARVRGAPLTSVSTWNNPPPCTGTAADVLPSPFPPSPAADAA